MKSISKRIFMLVTLVVMGLFIAACQPAADPPAVDPPPVNDVVEEPPVDEPPADEPAIVDGREINRIGVSMPTQDLQRWNQDGENLQAMLLDAGFDVDLQFGANDVAVQISQIENMIAEGADLLIIAAIDGDSLGVVLADAEAQNIPVIAYDRLIMGTSAVTYYATFDNYLVGQMQGEFVRDALDLANRAEDDPAFIEFFTGDPGDNNIFFFFPGAFNVLEPYIEAGSLQVLSGQTDIMQVATIDWNPANAQTRMEDLIAQFNYNPGGQRLDAVLCSNDSTAQGVVNALRNAGFTPDDIPLVTGQDADIVSVQNMVAGYQAMSVFKDTRVLAESVVEMVRALAEGREVPINNTTDYNNNTGYIPTFLNDPIIATLDNYRELLIDTGYYTEEQIYG